MTDLFLTLQQHLPSLSKTERRIARVVLDDPSAVVGQTITELAESASTSQATVARFCQNLGYGGYREFRIAVAEAASREQTTREFFSVADVDVTPSDSVQEVVTKIAYQEARAIEETARGLDLEALDRGVQAIQRADRIEVYGAGSSGLTAQDLTQKLVRFGLIGYTSSDAHLALTSVALTSAASTVIAISHSGRTLEALQVLNLAHERGAHTIAITNFPDSPLSEAADTTLATSAKESRFRSGAMSSRIAQMAVVDFIAVRLLQSGVAGSPAALQRTYDAVQAHRLPNGRRTH